MPTLALPRYEQYARAVAKGMIPYRAYLKHVSPATGLPVCSDKSAMDAVTSLNKDPRIAGRISELRASVHALADKEFAFGQLDMLNWHLDVMQTPIGHINEYHPLAQEFTYEEMEGRQAITDGEASPKRYKVKVKMPAKMDAARAITDIMGWKAAEKVEVTGDEGVSSWVQKIRQCTLDRSLEQAKVIECTTESLPDGEVDFSCD